MERHICRAGIAALACVLVIGPAIQAKTIRVGSSAAAGYRSLKPAVNAAANGDVIVVEEGTYTGDNNRDMSICNKAVTICSVDPNDPLVVAGTIIDCQGTASDMHRLFDVLAGETSRLSLEGLTILHGYGSVSGGIVFCEGAQFRAYNCTFSKNYVTWWGSVLSCRDSQVRLNGCTFSNNRCVSADRGAVFCATSDVDIENCTFQSNRGGAVVSFDARLTVERCIFEENTAGNGGAIYASVASNPESACELNLSRCTFTANSAGGSGGALYLCDFSAQIDRCTFTANTAAQDGGAILNYRAGTVLSDCVLVSNTAVGLGGGVHSLYKGTPQIVNCTFVANEAGQGGAIAGKGNARSLVSHNILWRNTANRGAALYLSRYDLGSVKGGAATVEYCDIEGGRDSAYAELDCTLMWSDGNMDSDPVFTGPAYDDYRLSPDSPCVDVGDPCYVPSAEARDLDNYPRQFGATVDLGAYEFRGLGPVYRFWSSILGKHFYTLLGFERDYVVSVWPYDWTYQDIEYYAYYEPIVETLSPVYRFWSPILKAHFWTIDEGECLLVQREFYGVWSYEGIVFYAFKQGHQPLDTLPVYRFWSGDLGYHVYTMDENEKDNLIENYPDLWTYEGIAWYTYSKPQDLGEVSYAFTQGAEGAWCTSTLAASIDGQEAQISSADLRLTPASTQMQMTIDFRDLTVVLDTLSVRTDTIQHTAEITLAGTDVKIPLVLSAQMQFALPTARGPYTIDPTTHLFADFREANQDIAGKDSYFTYSGSVRLGGQEVSFNRTMLSTRYELESAGELVALGLLPEGIYASIPLTFQWHRQQTRDLLAETQVDGRRVQIYVTYSYVGTQGLWPGERVE
ncbi:MAG: right-handed parallel beta-helix repeat-containing protein [Phycisphaerales bacterium]